MKIVIVLIVLTLCSCSRDYGSLSFENIESGEEYERELKNKSNHFASVSSSIRGNAFYYSKARLVTNPLFFSAISEPFEHRLGPLIEISDGDDTIIRIEYSHLSDAFDASSEFLIYIVVPEIQIGDSLQIDPDSHSFSVGKLRSSWGLYKYDQGVGYIRYISQSDNKVHVKVNITYFVTKYDRYDYCVVEQYKEKMEGTIVVHKKDD